MKQIIYVSILVKLVFFLTEGVCHLSMPESPLEKRWGFETQEQLEADRSPVEKGVRGINLYSELKFPFYFAFRLRLLGFCNPSSFFV